MAIQPAELLALALLVLAGLLWARGRRPTWSAVDGGVAAWLLAVAFSSAVASFREARLDPAVLRELCVAGYLALLYLAVRVVADDEVLAEAPSAFVASAALAALLGVAGVVASLAGIDNAFAFAA